MHIYALKAAFLAVMLAAPAIGQDRKDDAQPVWSEFTSKEQNFTASFPSAPQLESGSISGLNPLTRHSFSANDGDETVYSVVVLEYPEGKAPKSPQRGLFAEMVAAYAGDSGSRLRKKGAQTIAGVEGYEATADDEKSKLQHWIGLVQDGDRIYMLISAGPQRRSAAKDAEYFRDSFHFLRKEPDANRVHAVPDPY